MQAFANGLRNNGFGNVRYLRPAPSGAPLPVTTPVTPSDFNSASPGSAWFIHRVSNGATSGQLVCRTTGFDLLADLQEKLRDRLAETGPLPSFSGTIASSDVGVATFLSGPGDATGPGWDATTLRALYAVAQHDRAPSDALAAIAADASARRVSSRTLQTAIWITALNEAVASGATVYGAGSPDEVQFGRGTSFPVFGARPPVPMNATRSSNWSCVSASAEILGDLTPIAQTQSFSFSPLLVFVVIATAAFGVSALTRKTPRLEHIRKWKGRR